MTNSYLSKSIPATMRALELRSYDGGDDTLALVEKPVPRPGKDEVLVRVAASPVNPSDLMFLRGMYVRKKLPVVPGFECSGVVVTAGGSVLSRYLLGKRVACGAPMEGDGTWAEYMVTAAGVSIPLIKSTNIEQAASLIVNPFTAWALLDGAKQHGARAVAQTAAASALGRMLVRLAARRRVPLVNIVRRAEQVELLRSEGAVHVLDSSDADFDARLRDLCRELGVTVAFDAVAGEMTGRLLRAMPDNSRVVVYGALSQEGGAIDPRSLIFEGKQVEGFWLSRWLRSLTLPRRVLTARKVQKLLDSDLKTEIRARLPLEKAVEGLRDYAAEMTGGKVLFVPSLPSSE